jgi:hypothetical protein
LCVFSSFFGEQQQVMLQRQRQQLNLIKPKFLFFFVFTKAHTNSHKSAQPFSDFAFASLVVVGETQLANTFSPLWNKHTQIARFLGKRNTAKNCVV